MIVVDTDIATLLWYGKTDKLNQRIAALDQGQMLALTIHDSGGREALRTNGLRPGRGSE